MQSPPRGRAGLGGSARSRSVARPADLDLRTAVLRLTDPQIEAVARDHLADDVQAEALTVGPAATACAAANVWLRQAR